SLADAIVEADEFAADFELCIQIFQVGERVLKVESDGEGRRKARELLALELVFDPPELVVRVVDAGNGFAEAGGIFELACGLSGLDALFGERVPGADFLGSVWLGLTHAPIISISAVVKGGCGGPFVGRGGRAGL